MAKSISINKKDYKWRTALMYAVSDWDIERVSELLKLWADINIQDDEWYTALMWATYNKNIENSVNYWIIISKWINEICCVFCSFLSDFLNYNYI